MTQYELSQKGELINLSSELGYIALARTTAPTFNHDPLALIPVNQDSQNLGQIVEGPVGGNPRPAEEL
jgi:hypothetical protein